MKNALAITIRSIVVVPAVRVRHKFRSGHIYG